MKKLTTILLAMVMVFVFAACGGGGESGDSGEAKDEATKSTNGYISVMPFELDDYEAYVNDNEEKITISPPNKNDETAPAEYDEYVYLQTADPEGDIGMGFTGIDSYVEGEDYSMETMRADLEAYAAANPNIYSNLRDATVGDYDYIKIDCTTNGEASNYYYGVVDNRPVVISVVNEKLLDNEDVMKCLESVKWSFE